MDPWEWVQLKQWNVLRETLPPVPTSASPKGRPAADPNAATALRDPPAHRPHQLRRRHAVELVREGVPVHILQRQLGHANLAVTTVYLASVAPEEVLAVAHQRRQPTMQITTLLE